VGFTSGERIGNYRIESELGPTGWGHLLHAQHLVLPRRAIIKIVQTAFETDARLVVRTLREAYIMEAIAHPGVPIVYEAGLLEDRWPWFAFETTSGPTLDALLVSGSIPVIEVAALVRDISDILEQAHRRGVIHRALRPNGIVITAAVASRCAFPTGAKRSCTTPAATCGRRCRRRRAATSLPSCCGSRRPVAGTSSTAVPTCSRSA
jgi:serine/threonine protein kinase